MTLNFKVAHEGIDPGRYGAEIVVLQLLTTGWHMAEDRFTGHNQVRTGVEKCLVHQKVLLLATQCGIHRGNLAVEILANGGGRFVQQLHRFEQRRLHVERKTRIGDEDRRNTQCSTPNENRRTRIPGGITTGLEGTPDSSARER